MGDLHKPKFISSATGLGLPGNTISYKRNGSRVLTTEVWGKMNKPWREGDTIIAKPGYKWVTEWVVGRNYVVTRFLDIKNTIIAHYFDVCSPVTVKNDIYSFYDWYLDVWCPFGKSPFVLDMDELVAAKKAGYIVEK